MESDTRQRRQPGQPQWPTIAKKNVKGLWKDLPIFANDLSALSWG